MNLHLLQIINLCFITQFMTVLPVLYSFLIYLSCSLYTTPPVWVTSNYVRAGNQNVISIKTNQTATPTPNHNFFFSSPLTGTPFLGYGIKAYEGYDYLGEEQFEVNRTYLDRYQFRVVVKILGVTNILRLNVPYIAIDPSFPHHINSFDNVPVNYSAGPIANISNGNGGGTKIYTNLIDYTVQASGLVHNTFQAPYNRNKVLLFMTSMFMTGKTQKANPPPYRPIDLHVYADVISASHYNLTVTLSTEVNITRLHFSMIIFDETDVMSSGLYMLVYQKISLPYTGGFIPVPAEFTDNFILGFLDFFSNKTGVILDFQWEFQTINGVHGAFMPLSVGQTGNPYGTQTINRVTYTSFYIKTWICPALTYFDPSQNLCTSCPIVNCINCFNLTVCSTCDEFNDFFLNSTTFACDACNLVGCLNCSNLSVCQKCDSLAGYELRNGTCFMCASVVNNFINFTTESCQFCSVPNCLICSSLVQCSLCDVNDSYYLPNNTSPCTFCDNSANYFINSTTLQCQLCQILGCIDCYSFFDCQACDIFSGYILNGTQCYTCFDLGTCLNGTNFTNSSNSSNATANNNQTNITINNITNNSNDNNTSNSTDNSTSNLSNSSSVNITNSTINVDNSTNTTSNSTSNIIADNSTINGTNQASNSASNATNFTNLTNLTNGSFVSPLPIVEELLLTHRTGCNSFKTVVPLELLASRQFKLLSPYFQNIGVQVVSTRVNVYFAEIMASYSRDISNQTLRLVISNGVDKYVFVFEYTPILPAVFYDESQCDALRNTELLMQTVQIASYILLITSLLSCKIVGLELFGVLQLAYFSLSEYDFFPIFLYSLRNFNTFNGLNLKFFEETVSLPSVLKEINISSSFLNNCNIMLIVLFSELLVAVILYVSSKFSKIKKMQLIGLKLLKQGFLTLVLFNVYNVGFSSGFHYRYAQPSYFVQRILNLLSIIATSAAVIVSILAMLVTSSTDYGQFMYKFKDNPVCRLYIPATIILRFLMGFYISTNRENSETTLIVIAFSLTFIMYNLTNLPFSDALQNYRSNIIHITQLIILLSANYYRQMKLNTPVSIKARLHTLSIFMLIMIVFSIFFSFVVLIYEFVIAVRSYINKRKIKKLEQSKIREESNQTIEDFA